VTSATAAAVVVGLSLPALAATATAATQRLSKQAAAVRFAQQAFSHHEFGGPLRQLRSLGAGVRATTDISSTNWSGYADNNSSRNVYTAVKGTWVEPAFRGSCGAKATSLAAFWVGLDGFNTKTVEQDGTLIECYLGTVYTFDWWEMYPTNVVQMVKNVSPGDKIIASVTFASGTYSLKVRDASARGASFSTSQRCGTTKCVNGSAEWIGEAPCCASGSNPYPLSDFGTWTVTKAHATSGTRGPISAFPNDDIEMVNLSDSYALAAPGALNGAGNSFTDQWYASS